MYAWNVSARKSSMLCGRKQTQGRWSYGGDNVTCINDDTDQFHVDYVEKSDLPPNWCIRRIAANQVTEDAAGGPAWEGSRCLP